jgi:type III restriction enzyme
MHLHQALQQKVRAWVQSGYKSEDYPVISEILEYQTTAPVLGQNTRQLRFLRGAQVDALISYWYLRLVEQTPGVIDFYRRLFPKPTDLLESLGLGQNQAAKDAMLDAGGIDGFLERIRDDDEFVAAHKLEALRETLSLDYPSYILALAMGSGKTALVGAIIATEFAMSVEYPDGPFVQNALVFAPGTTILGSLRELAALPYDRILPPRHHKFFSASVKLIFTRDGDPDIPVVRGDSFNVIITNTEKIRITKDTIRKGDLGALFSEAKLDDARSEVANRRLQAIASLPHLAVFSDEAHHTFGRTMANDLKRVRQTIDYLHQRSPNLVAVINTTGTPYLQRQPLRDVVFWYGLSAGIRDGILKSVAGQIHGYSFEPGQAPEFLAAVIDDFFAKYREVTLPDGAPAKIAIYFPQVADLTELRPIIETRLSALGISPDLVLSNHSGSTAAEIGAFNRLNDPSAPHRVILLVNKGTEGWNCPSLFACALARKLKTSNNFVLQAASRCLRQVPGNPHKASIYLTMDNRRTLEKELQETYGESVHDLNRAATESRTTHIRLRKLNIPPLVVRQIVRRVEKTAAPAGDAPLRLDLPAHQAGALTRHTFDLTTTGSALIEQGVAETLPTPPDTIDLYTAATRLAAVYRHDFWHLKDQLAALYPGQEVPVHHLEPLAAQVEAHTSHYTIREEEIDVALALVKPGGFDQEIDPASGDCVYTAQISYSVSQEKLLRHVEAFASGNPRDLGFHYSPYNFDSGAEAEFFETLLAELQLNKDDIEDIYFTGALTSPNKTDFIVEYLDTDGA